ncbi:MAG TPA: hypothetical protein PLP05_00340 [Sedimentisphaerales bacterium]|nr:hypothetical protein [Sedimentisphaerales bacterium]
MQNEKIEAFSPQLVPWQIWITAGMLRFEGISNFFTIFDNPAAIVWLTAKVLFITGLLRKWKWVYIVFLIGAGIHVVYFALAGAFVVAILNLALIILPLWVFRYYFPKDDINPVSERQTI